MASCGIQHKGQFMFLSTKYDVRETIFVSFRSGTEGVAYIKETEKFRTGCKLRRFTKVQVRLCVAMVTVSVSFLLSLVVINMEVVTKTK